MIFEREYQQNVLSFIREIQQKDDESGNDCDAQDQQPTEAADGKTLGYAFRSTLIRLVSS